MAHAREPEQRSLQPEGMDQDPNQVACAKYEIKGVSSCYSILITTVVSDDL